MRIQQDRFCGHTKSYLALPFTLYISYSILLFVAQFRLISCSLLFYAVDDVRQLFDNEFYINKGLNDDVYEGCNVICDEGLLGIVVESYDDYAKVRAIIDDRANVTAEIGSAGYLCNVEGSLQNMDNGYLLATDIDKNAIVTEGDKVITSSVSDRYLYGITIGYVTSVEQDPNNLTQTARITLTVNFSDIKDVLVILDRKQEVNY